MFRDSAHKISITETSVSPDLHDASVYFSVLGEGDDVAAAAKFLSKHAGALCQKLFKRLRLKHCPRLNFIHDNSMARGQNILKILETLRNQE
jgi:ribosome-binding factor A